jgi:hypothetical protein
MKVRRLPMTRENILASLALRKTVTRRVAKVATLKPSTWTHESIEAWRHDDYGWQAKTAKYNVWSRGRLHCPYGAPGDPLVLTETWRPKSCGISSAAIEYRADGAVLTRDYGDRFAEEKIERALKHGKWLPPMFMQAWASRAPAVNKEVRVERVQEITVEDVRAEGVKWTPERCCHKTDCLASEIDRFSCLWDSINEKRGHGWDKNDWVWVVGYELTERKGSS